MSNESFPPALPGEPSEPAPPATLIGFVRQGPGEEVAGALGLAATSNEFEAVGFREEPQGPHLQEPSHDSPQPSPEALSSGAFSASFKIDGSTQAPGNPGGLQPDDPDDPQGPSLMKIGTAMIIGAMAANVIGFRYSRWAVGKDIHRAWETHQRNTRARTASNASRAAHDDMAEARRRAERAQREHAERNRAARERAQRSQRADNHAREDRRVRDEARTAYESWERQFRGPDGSFWRSEFKVEFDPRLMEELLRAQRGAARGARGNPFSMQDDILQEFLRAAQAAQAEQSARGSRQRRELFDDDFDPFRFWEQMHGAEWKHFEQGTGQRAARNGVFHRANLNRHYSVLGLDSSATDAQIKAAYRKEAMKWHPDRYRGGNPEAAAKKFREITEAYNALTKK